MSSLPTNQLTAEAQRVLLANDRELIRRATALKERRQSLDQATQRWMVVFSDCLHDVLTDANHDLRRRTRSVTADLEQRIDEGDPAAQPDEINAQLMAGIADALHQNSIFVMAAALTMNARLEEHFDGLLGGLPGCNARALRPISGDGALDLPTAPKRGAAMFTGMRGSYGGIALCGTAVGMAGPTIGATAAAVVLPATLLAGVLFGRKVAADESERQLTQRRAIAKQKVRRFVEDVLFHENKHRRDVVRTWSRSVRELAVHQVSELRKSTANAELDAAQAVATYRQQAEEWLEQMHEHSRAETVRLQPAEK